MSDPSTPPNLGTKRQYVSIEDDMDDFGESGELSELSPEVIKAVQESPILLNNPALFTNDTLSGPIDGKVLVRPSISIAARGWIQLFVSNSRNQNILINPSQITACAAKVVIVSQLKCLYELRKNYALP